MPYTFMCQIKNSPVHGYGVYAGEDIPKGAVYWVWDLPNHPPLIGEQVKPNKAYKRQELQGMEDKDELTKILHGGFYYEDGDVFIELKDGSHWTNHSDDDWTCQVVYDPSRDYRKMTSVAVRDIKAGEEITESYVNYMSTKAKWVNDLMIKYNPERKVLEDHIEKNCSPKKEASSA